MSKSIDLKVEIVQLDSIIPYINNAKLHPPEQVAQIAASITAFGFNDPIGVSGGTILTGHGRLMAARQLGMQTVPIIRLDHLSPAEQKAYCLAHNKIGANSGFDPELLKIEFEALNEIKWDLSLTGFDPIEIKESLNFVFNDPDKEGTDTEPGDVNLNEPAYTQLGDIYQLGMHKVMCGDSTDAGAVFLLLEKQKIDMVFTDPPYGMKLDADFSGEKSSLKMLREKGLKGGRKYNNVIGDHEDFKPELIETIFNNFGNVKEIFLWGADYYSELLKNKNDGSFFVWDKRLEESADKMYGSCFELCWSKQKHKREIVRIKWAGVFGTEKEFDKKRCHPTQKPTLLAEWFISKYSEPNNIICDLYVGSGSTLIACSNLGRICRGMELDPHYCDVIVKRFQKHTKSQDIKLIRGNETVPFDMLKKVLDFEL